jgi:hypothetical protein
MNGSIAIEPIKPAPTSIRSPASKIARSADEQGRAGAHEVARTISFVCPGRLENSIANGLYLCIIAKNKRIIKRFRRAGGESRTAGEQHERR